MMYSFYLVVETGRAPSLQLDSILFKLPFCWDETGHAPSLQLDMVLFI